jgi:hypothetical protein
MTHFFISILIGLFSFPSFSISFVVSKTEQDTSSVKSDLSRIKSDLDSLKSKLTLMESTLEIPERINYDLGMTLETMDVIQGLAIAAKTIPDPDIQAISADIDITINQVAPDLDDIKKVFNDLSQAVSPIITLTKAEIAVVSGLISAIRTMESNILDPFYSNLLKAQSCVDSSAVDKKSCMQEKLDSLVAPLSPKIAAIDSELKRIITTSDQIKAAADKLIAPLQAAESKLIAVTKFNEAMEAIEKPFHDLDSLMKKRFTVSFPYPDPHNIFKKDTYTITMSAMDVIHGVKHIEDEIKDKIHGALYDAAKLFGMSKLVNDLWNDFNHPFDAIMKALKVKLKPDLSSFMAMKASGGTAKSNSGSYQQALGKLSNLNSDLSFPKDCSTLSSLCR